MWRVSLLVLIALPAVALAEPKVCGNQPPLGDFAPERCPVMKDDGVGADEVKGDGVYSLEVALLATPLLKYKILPSGVYGPDEVRQVGDCGPNGKRDNPTGDIVIPQPETAQPARFYYDSARRSGGDSLMTASPAGTRWAVVGAFQNKPFDPALGVVVLTAIGGGLLRGSITLARALPAGWEWKVLEHKGTYEGARKLGADGWSYTPCDSRNAVGEEARSGDLIEFYVHTRTGRIESLRTASGDAPEEPAGDGPPPPDAAPLIGDAGDMLDPAALPGIRCDCRMGPAPPRAGGAFLCAALLLVPFARRRRRRRRR